MNESFRVFDFTIFNLGLIVAKRVSVLLQQLVSLKYVMILMINKHLFPINHSAFLTSTARRIV